MRSFRRGRDRRRHKSDHWSWVCDVWRRPRQTWPCVAVLVTHRSRLQVRDAVEVLRRLVVMSESVADPRRPARFARTITKSSKKKFEKNRLKYRNLRLGNVCRFLTLESMHCRRKSWQFVVCREVSVWVCVSNAWLCRTEQYNVCKSLILFFKMSSNLYVIFYFFQRFGTKIFIIVYVLSDFFL